MKYGFEVKPTLTGIMIKVLTEPPIVFNLDTAPYNADILEERGINENGIVRPYTQEEKDAIIAFEEDLRLKREFIYTRVKDDLNELSRFIEMISDDPSAGISNYLTLNGYVHP